MDTFKIDFFNRDNPNKVFPWFETLTRDECDFVRARLVSKFAINTVENSQTFFFKLLDKSSSVRNINVESQDFNLSSLLSSLNLAPTQYGYINWEQFDKIDRFNFNDLSSYFEDICTGYLSDDVCIFDDTLNWVLFIMHFGGVQIVISDAQQ